MKYALIESGGKQYVAREGQSVDVDLLPDEVGSTLKLDAVLLAVDGGSVAVGRPNVEGATVQARVEGHVKGPKIVVFRYIPKERFRRKQGHRQQYTRLRIEKVSFPGMSTREGVEEAAAKPAAKPAARRSAKKPAPKTSPVSGRKQASG